MIDGGRYVCTLLAVVNFVFSGREGERWERRPEISGGLGVGELFVSELLFKREGR